MKDLQLSIEEIRHRFRLQTIAKDGAVRNYDQITSDMQSNVEQVCACGFMYENNHIIV